MAIIDRLLDGACEDALIADGNLRVLAEIEERVGEIEKGSLKEMIKYYEDIYGAEHSRKLYKMYTGEQLTNYGIKLDHVALEKLCRDCLEPGNAGTGREPKVK